MLEHSDSAKFAKHKFFSNYNDIDVFIEDTAKESKKIFTEILRRVMNGSVSIESIFPIGSKPTVIKRCKADQGSRKKRAIYIVDGDYELATSTPKPALLRFYRLNKYCIENYLLDDDAIISVINDSTIDQDIESIAKILDMDGWRTRVTPHLNKVTTALIAASLKVCDCLPTVKLQLTEIEGDEHDKIDPLKALAFEHRYREEIDKKHGSGTFSALTSILGAANGGRGIDFNKNASGKSLILPLVKCRILRKLDYDLRDFPLFKARLASRCDVSDLADLPNHIV